MASEGEPLGNCYQDSAELVLDQERWGRGGPQLHLVHGYPTLQRPPFEKYGHAWVEYDDEAGNRIVRDPTADVVMPAILYYALGNIDASETRSYDADEARRWMLKSGHWGPWEEPRQLNPIPVYETPFREGELVARVRNQTRTYGRYKTERVRVTMVMLFVKRSALERLGIPLYDAPQLAARIRELPRKLIPATPHGYAPVGYIALGGSRHPDRQNVFSSYLSGALTNKKLGAYLYSAAADAAAKNGNRMSSTTYMRSPAADRVWRSRTLQRHGYDVARPDLDDDTESMGSPDPR